ncbi:MAG: DUF6599 family protein [Candidatus Hydrogenedens sp.]
MVCLCLCLGISCATMNSTNKNTQETIVFSFPENVNQWKLEKTNPDRYDSETLYDYIDGNAEVYRSLGVREVLAYRWSNPQQVEIFMDIFDMGNSALAYGAYHHDIRDQKDVGLGVESEGMNNSLAFWKDRYFISIVGMGDSPEINQTVMELGKIIDHQIPKKGNPPEIIHLLPEKGQVKSHVHYFKDYDLLKVHFFITDENILQLGKDTEGILVRYFLPEQDERFQIILVRYKDKKKALLVGQNFKNFIDKSEKEMGKEERSKKFGFNSILIHSRDKYLILIIDWKKRETADLYVKDIETRIKR